MMSEPESYVGQLVLYKNSASIGDLPRCMIGIVLKESRNNLYVIEWYPAGKQPFIAHKDVSVVREMCLRWRSYRANNIDPFKDED
jgi:uncharacterized membrane protein